MLCSEPSGACSVGIDSRRNGGRRVCVAIDDTGGHGARPGGRAECGTGGQRRGELGAAPVREVRV